MAFHYDDDFDLNTEKKQFFDEISILKPNSEEIRVLYLKVFSVKNNTLMLYKN